MAGTPVRDGRVPWRAPLAGVLALALAACVDFTELTIVGGQQPARLQVTVRLLEDSTLCRGGCRLPDGTPVPPGPGGIVAWFDARLRPGADAGGVPRDVADETLVLLGQSFEPVERTVLGERVYQGGLAISGDALDAVTVTLTPPAPEGVGASIPPLRWRVPGTEGPDTLTLAPGEDLLLRLAYPAEESDPPLQFGTWALELVGNPPLRISANGLPPEELRVPPYYLPAPPAVFPVRLDVFTGATIFPDPGDYMVAVVLDVRLGWTVRAEAQEPDPAVRSPWTTSPR